MVGKVNVGRGVVARDGMEVIGLGCDELNVVLQVGWYRGYEPRSGTCL